MGIKDMESLLHLMTTPNYSDNPYWTINEILLRTEEEDYGNAKLTYNFT
jgi:hypothetical protein